MEISWFEFLIIAFATFRFTHLLVFDSIADFIRRPFMTVKEKTLDTGEVFEIVSAKGKGVRKFTGELLSCYWCTGVWIAAIFVGLFVWIPHFIWPVFIVLAIAGIASFLESILK